MCCSPWGCKESDMTTINSTNEKMLPSKYTFEIGNAVSKYLYHLFKRKKSFLPILLIWFNLHCLLSSIYKNGWELSYSKGEKLLAVDFFLMISSYYMYNFLMLSPGTHKCHHECNFLFLFWFLLTKPFPFQPLSVTLSEHKL